MFIYTFSVDLWLRPHYAAGSAGCPMRLTVRAVKSGFRPVLVYAFKDTKMKMNVFGKSLVVGLTATMLLLSGCATQQSSRVIVSQKVESYNTAYSGVKSRVVVGKFVNRSSFQNGIFSNGTDRLGSQAKTILISHLQQTNRFAVLDRDNMHPNLVKSRHLLILESPKHYKLKEGEITERL